MKLGSLKNIVGSILVGLHLVALFLCYYSLKSRLDPSDFRITIYILCPVTAVYAMAYVRDVTKSMFANTTDADEERSIRLSMVILSTLFSFVFSAAVIYSIHEFSVGGTMKPDDLKEQLALIETALGGFLGLIIETLFGKPAQPHRDPNA
ncbi:hypothetical protein NML43_26495 [Rhodopseudomonas palustris]|uniref:hypothetical protein n=1 Tax=Rhodopseudomonas palustris TaxID=1076 RepID=UPI0020CCD13D|nr:hypothetical protein [Rhodopseudomonas palustris]MCP9630656.1 hypothetical protein [Rhodopseudomonas palustris]